METSINGLVKMIVEEWFWQVTNRMKLVSSQNQPIDCTVADNVRILSVL